MNVNAERAGFERYLVDSGKCSSLRGANDDWENGSYYIYAEQWKVWQARALFVPEGYALVPERMHLDANVIESINFHCGDGQEDAGFGSYSDGLIWIGFVEDDDGVKSYGLNIATAEYPEEGSTQLVEFAAKQAAK